MGLTFALFERTWQHLIHCDICVKFFSQQMCEIRDEVRIKLFPTWPFTADHWNQVKEDVCLQKFLSGILMNVQPSYCLQYEKHLYLFTYRRVWVYNQHYFMFWRCSVLLFWAADYWQRKCRRTQVGSRGCDASRDNRWWLMLFWVKMKTTLIWAILISDRLHVAPVAVERTYQAQQSIHNYSNWIINQEAIDALLQRNEEEEEELWPRLTTTDEDLSLLATCGSWTISKQTLCGW